MLITKGGGECIGIGLVEVIRKVCASIMNNRLWAVINLNDILHGFRQGRGTATAIMEENLDQQLAGLCHDPLFQVFLDVQKAYDSLDRVRCMEIIRGYIPGTNLQRLLHQYREKQGEVTKAGKLFGHPFGTERGVT